MSKQYQSWTLLPARTLTNVKGPDGEQICQLDIKSPHAPLIAAAPEMLAILKQVERTFGDRFPDVIEVIAKAEGRKK